MKLVDAITNRSALTPACLCTLIGTAVPFVEFSKPLRRYPMSGFAISDPSWTTSEVLIANEADQPWEHPVRDISVSPAGNPSPTVSLRPDADEDRTIGNVRIVDKFFCGSDNDDVSLNFFVGMGSDSCPDRVRGRATIIGVGAFSCGDLGARAYRWVKTSR